MICQLTSIERRSMDTNPKSMVEIPHRPTNDPNAFDNQLRTIKSNIKEAAFRKISDGGRSRLNTTCDLSEENLAGRACGVHDDGAFASGENDSVYGANDSRNHSHQSHLGNARDHQALNDSISGQNGVEEGAGGSMEIEGHRG